MTRLDAARAIRRPRKRTLAIALAVAVVLGAVGTWLYLGQTVSWRLQAAEEEASRQDPGWRLRDLLASREVVPDEENSALRIARIRRLLPGGWQPYPGGMRPISRPGRPVPADLMSQAGEVPRNERLGLTLAAELRDAMGRYPEVAAEARKLASMPRGRFELKIEPNVITTRLDEQQGSRTVARFLQTDAYARAEAGDLDGALESCRALLNSGRALGDEPFLISQLIRIAIVGVAIDTAQRVLAQGEPSDEALAAFQEAVAEESRHSYAWTGFRGERAGMDDMFTLLANGGADRTMLGLLGAPAPMTYLPLGPTFYRYNHALFLEELNEAVRIARKPDPELLDAWTGWDAGRKPPQNVVERFAASLKNLLTPAMTAIVQAHLRARSQQLAAIAALAAERQRRASGSFPASVAEIEPRFLPVPAIDPYDGRPLRLTPTDDGLAVYSVGPDREDNGGKFKLYQRPDPGSDQGFSLYRPALRGLPSPRELPDDVFQRAHDAEAHEDEPL